MKANKNYEILKSIVIKELTDFARDSSQHLALEGWTFTDKEIEELCEDDDIKSAIKDLSKKVRINYFVIRNNKIEMRTGTYLQMVKENRGFWAPDIFFTYDDALKETIKRREKLNEN